ncbi:glucosaminidase domain-containing protein [Lacticaseibacillus suihuaensis]
MKGFNQLSKSRVWRGILVAAGSVAVLGSAAIASQSGSAATPRVVAAATTDVNGYIASHNILPVPITKEWHTFEEFNYGTATELPDGVVFHYTDNATSFSARDGADYEISGAWTSAFVHDFIDARTILNIHNPDLGAWGAGPKANARFVQFELVTARNADEFARSIANAASYTAQMLVRYGLKPSLVNPANSQGTIWTHHNVSTLLGGTDHVDPDAYIAKWGYTLPEFLTLVNRYYQPLVAAQPNSNAISYNKYVRITSPNYRIYQDLNLAQVRANSASYLNQTLQARVHYRKPTTGYTYLSLYDAAGKWVGYMNATGAAVAAGPQGTAIQDGRYVTVTKANYTLWRDFDGHAKQASQNLVGQTFLSKVKYNHFNGSVYLSLYDHTGKWQGYLNQTGATVAPDAGGLPTTVAKTVTITKPNYTRWNDLQWQVALGDTTALVGQQVQVRAQYHHYNGETYDAIYSPSGAYLGLLNDAAVAAAAAVGPAITDGRYVTVTAKNYTLWRDFDWNAKQDSTALVGQTFQARVRYVHRNGATYLSLYDHNGQWQGYLNQTGVTVAPDAGGIAQAATGYVTLAKPRYTIWNNLSFAQKVVADTTATVGRTYQRTALYHHFNGSTYVGLSDAGRFVGYINTDAVVAASPQGPAITDGRYVTVTAKNYTLWRSFDWVEKQDSTALVGRTFQARRRYNHQNGATYLSLYDHNGTWQGYLNQTAVAIAPDAGGTATKASGYVTLAKPRYTIWNNLSFDQKVVADTTATVGQIYQLTGVYHHFNGSTYDALSQAGQFVGYINAAAVTTTTAPQGKAIALNRYATIVRSGAKLYDGFDFAGIKSETSQLLDQTFLAKRQYHHADGHTYYSLYQNNDKWLGYVDADYVALGQSAAGAAIAMTAQVTIQRAGYNRLADWGGASLGSTTGLVGQTAVVRQRFRHFNGSTYYDLYTTGGSHLGIVNALATTAATGVTPVAVPANLYGVKTTGLTAAQSAFLRQLVSIAIPVAKQYGLYPSIAVMQAITESGWGTSELAVNANAYFGVKADVNWPGASYLKLTGEVFDGQAVKVIGAFRKYDSLADSIIGYAQKLTTSPYYTGCLRVNAPTWQQAVSGLAAYATSPTYQPNLIAGITRYGLDKLDAVAVK